jgi:hypothetical protein
MRFRKWKTTAAILLLAGAVTAPAVVSATPALAAGNSNICGNRGTGYCLNDWNGGGSGNPVKMYYGNYYNDHFSIYYLNKCNAGDQVLGAPYYCPFANHALDNSMAGDFIFAEYYYNSADSCVATNGSGDAILGACPDALGNGGANGTVMVQEYTSSCGPVDSDFFLAVDRYWSDQYGTKAFQQSGGNPGIQAFLNYTSQSTATCWGYVLANN